MEDDAGPLQPETMALRRLQSVMADAESALARRMRMHPTDLAAMSHLSFSDGTVGPGELAGRLGLSPAAATELVDRLTEAGHVERHRDLADRRRIRLEPTPGAVTDIMARLDGLIAQVEAEVLAHGPEDREVILGFLERITAVYASWAVDEQD